MPTSLSYDGFGRRTSRTVNGTTTSFLYDGSNLVQELSGSTPTATYLTGLAVDEVFSRSNSSGTVAYLTDGIVDAILYDPSTTFQIWNHPTLGPIIDVISPDGRGIRYTLSGEFVGFLEPPRDR